MKEITLLERTELVIREGEEDAFAAAMQEQGIGLLASVPGVVSVSMGRGVEHPSKFMLLIHWDNMDAHVAYKTTRIAADIRVLIGRFAKGASMEHFRMG
jgi:heme-degrading monooxygenase HmoA